MGVGYCSVVWVGPPDFPLSQVAAEPNTYGNNMSSYQWNALLLHIAYREPRKWIHETNWHKVTCYKCQTKPRKSDFWDNWPLELTLWNLSELKQRQCGDQSRLDKAEGVLFMNPWQFPIRTSSHHLGQVPIRTSSHQQNFGGGQVPITTQNMFN